MIFREFLRKLELDDLYEALNLGPHRYKDRMKKLKLVIDQEIKKGTPKDNIWVTFTNVPRINIRLLGANRETKKTPSGVFAYPAKFIANKTNFEGYGYDRAYMVVFKSKEQVRLDTEDKYINAKLKPLRYNVDTPSQESRVRTFIDYISMNYNRPSVLSPLYDELDNLMAGIDFNEPAYSLDDKDLIELVHKLVEKHISSINKSMLIYFKDKRIRAYDGLYRFDPRINSAKVYIVADNQVWINDSLASIIEREPRLNKLKKYISRPLTPTQAFMFEREAGIDGSLSPLSMMEKISLAQREIPRITKKALFLKAKILAFLKKPIPKPLDANFPYKEKFIEICKKYNLDLDKALRFTNIEGRNEDHFAYNLASALADQWARKDDVPKFGRWNKILIMLGIKAAVDIDGAKTIHTAEPEQGVFLDPRNIEIISVINNEAQSDGRPTATPDGDYKAFTSQYNIDQSRFGSKQQSLIMNFPRLAKMVFDRKGKIDSVKLRAVARTAEELSQLNTLEKPKPRSNLTVQTKFIKSKIFAGLNDINFNELDKQAVTPEDKSNIRKLKILKSKLLLILPENFTTIKNYLINSIQNAAFDLPDDIQFEEFHGFNKIIKSLKHAVTLALDILHQVKLDKIKDTNIDYSIKQAIASEIGETTFKPVLDNIAKISPDYLPKFKEFIYEVAPDIALKMGIKKAY